MTTKITKRDRYTTLLGYTEVQTDPGMVEFIQNELALLDKKKASAKSKANSDANAELEQTILGLMAPNTVYLTSQVIALNPEWTPTNMSTSRMSSRLNAMVNDGRLVKLTEKGRAYFQLA